MIKGLEGLIYEERLKHVLFSQMTANMRGESNDNSLQVFKAWAHQEKSGSV